MFAGLFCCLGILFFMKSYQGGYINSIAILQYTQILWGVVFGYILFQSIPNIYAISGAVIIIMANLLNLKTQSSNDFMCTKFYELWYNPDKSIEDYLNAKIEQLPPLPVEEEEEGEGEEKGGSRRRKRKSIKNKKNRFIKKKRTKHRMKIVKKRKSKKAMKKRTKKHRK